MSNTLEKFIFPEQKSERISRLEKAKEILKSEFINLDNIIDELIRDISPWYITPEIIERPVVVSLFGMSGTGKTSVIRRLVDLLGLSGKTIFFDCGEEDNNNESSLSEKITDTFGLTGDNIVGPQNSVFVFDEFQYARTITETGKEVTKPSLRLIWNIMDNGIIKVSSYNYGASRFSGFLDDLSMFVKEHEDIKLENGIIKDRDDVRSILLALGLFHYGRNITELFGWGKAKDNEGKSLSDISEEEEEGEKEDVLAPLQVVGRDHLRFIANKLNSLFGNNYGMEKIKELNSVKTLGELYEILSGLKNVLLSSREFDFSKSIVFIIGNLDEAFTVQSNLSPDIDADTFYYKTCNVSISDIKEALKRRFRAEQIARFGNNLIKYPTFNKEGFKNIISKEIKRIVDNFYRLEGIEIKVSEGIEKLIYREGVFPTQGIRPVFTTIGSIFTPLLSDILIGKDKIVDNKVEIKLKLENIDVISFNQKEISILIIFSKEKGYQKEVVIPLQLGPLRDPKRRITQYCNAVHEVGHAIVSIHETGEYPINLVAVSSGNGGFCDTYDKDKEGEIETREDIDSEIRVLLAGYYAELLIFKEPQKCLMGSGSDISNAWYIFSDVAYKVGYFEPFLFSNYSVDGSPVGIPNGIGDSDVRIKDCHGRVYGSIKEAIQSRFSELSNDTNHILEEEKNLIKIIALELGEKGSMTRERLKELVEKNGNILTKEYIEAKKESRSGRWYFDTLSNFK